MKKTTVLRRTMTFLLTLSAVFAFAGCKKSKKDKPSTTSKGTTTSSKSTTQSQGGVDAENLLEDGDFSNVEKKYADSGDNTIGKWKIFSLVGGSGDFDVNKDKQLEVKVKTMTDEMHCVQLGYDGFGISKKSIYVLEFDAKATYNRKVEVRIQENGGNYENYITEGEGGDIFANLTTEMQHFSFQFTSAVNDKAPRLAINCGHMEGDPLQDGGVITFDNFSLKCIYDSGDKGEDPLNRPKIKLNQVGFLPNQKKQAVFVGNAGELDARFYVYDITDPDNPKKAFDGKTQYIQLVGTNKKSMEYVGIGDFSSLTTPGRYKITTNYYCGESYEFEIYDDVYDSLSTDLVMMLYRQRCGVVEGNPDDPFAHDACHSGEGQQFAELYNDSTVTVEVTGGWHDAGDFGKYVVPGAQTVADLLMTYDRYGDVFYYDTFVNDDESIPDILEEAMWELDWMLKMQASNGQVYHKVTSLNFPDGNVGATADKSKLYVSPTSYAATADFAAVMAMASRIIAEDGCADSKASAYATAAQNAYNALANMDAVSYEEPKDASGSTIFKTGTYPDADLFDELSWAAIELYALTENTDYLNTFKANYTKTEELGLGWANVNGFAVITALDTIDATDTTYKACKAALLAYADELVERVHNLDSEGNIIDHEDIDGVTLYVKDVYNTTLETFEWGSNLTIAANGMLLDYAVTYADSARDKAYYFDLLQDQLNYLLGQNACCYCFVTGYGTLSPENPHHRPSVAADEAMPGMLVGGPDANFDENGGDAIATQYCKGEAPALCYIDHNNSWSTNEVTIYWNSPLIYLLYSVMCNVPAE